MGGWYCLTLGAVLFTVVLWAHASLVAGHRATSCTLSHVQNPVKFRHVPLQSPCHVEIKIKIDNCNAVLMSQFYAMLPPVLIERDVPSVDPAVYVDAVKLPRS